jgi:tRNA A37 methylthiotransferase MiaB
LIDTVHEVLVEKKVGRLCTARTDANTKVYFHTDDATVTAGKFIAVKITECRITTLVGEAAAPAG